MEIRKASGPMGEVQADARDLEQINRLSRKKLKAEEVYLFSIHLCDNEVDRDGERFEPETLTGLAELFVGKSGIFDHQWSAKGQTARIYRTELVREPERVTAAGDAYCYLKGYAYMLRTEGNQELIARIEGGILKEVSVGCAVERTVCSICGEPLEQCGHQKGRRYGGQLCFGRLQGALDAYEWSFVAVPAQKEAGVLKQKEKRRERMELEKQLAGKEECLRELEQLRKEAAAGRLWLARLREEVVRLGCLADKEMEPEALRAITDKLDGQELETLKKTYARRAGDRFPLKTQLEYGETWAEKRDQDGAFLI